MNAMLFLPRRDICDMPKIRQDQIRSEVCDQILNDNKLFQISVEIWFTE